MKPAAEAVIVTPLPAAEIPRKRYFAIGEVSDLCGIKPHVLRYWEQEFPQLKPIKRRGNRRYYQFDDVEMVRRIRSLLYEQGFTIGGARQRLREARVEKLELLAATAPVSAAPAAGVVAPSPKPVNKPAVLARKAEINNIRNELEEMLRRWTV